MNAYGKNSRLKIDHDYEVKVEAHQMKAYLAYLRTKIYI